MSFEFNCPEGHRLEAEDRDIGTKSKCPYCGEMFLVPSPTGAVPPSPAVLPTPPPPRTPPPPPVTEAPSPMGGPEDDAFGSLKFHVKSAARKVSNYLDKEPEKLDAASLVAIICLGLSASILAICTVMLLFGNPFFLFFSFFAFILSSVALALGLFTQSMHMRKIVVGCSSVLIVWFLVLCVLAFLLHPLYERLYERRALPRFRR